MTRATNRSQDENLSARRDETVREQLNEWAEGQRCPHCQHFGLMIEWRRKPALICPECDFEASAP